MDRENFEELIRSKFEAQGTAPPSGVWAGISKSLNEQALAYFQSTQSKYRWLAVAAVLLAMFSFALHFGSSDQVEEPASYNALLPSSSDHFRFFEPQHSVQEPTANHQLWSNILFVKEGETDHQRAKPTFLVSEGEVRRPSETLDIQGLDAVPTMANVKTEVSPYYVAYFSSGTNESRNETGFWAGVEAGAGNFNPNFSGSEPLSANVDFDALASSLGRSDFVNPISSASESDMNDGTITSLGVDFGVRMGKKWTLESGVLYTSVNNTSIASINVVDIYTISGGEIVSIDGGENVAITGARETEIEESSEHSIDLDNNLRFTSIPLKAGYFLVDDKFSMRLNAGFAANYFIGNQVNDPTGRIQTTEQTNAYNTWSFDGLTGFELGYSLFDNFNITLEPNYRQSITPLSSSINNRSGFMVQTGLRYVIE